MGSSNTPKTHRYVGDTSRPRRGKMDRADETLSYMQNCRSAEEPLWKAYFATKPNMPEAWAALAAIKKHREKEAAKR